MSYIEHLSASSCLVIGVFAALATALAGTGWRPRAWHRAIILAVFVAIGLVAFTNRATAQLTGLPAAVTAPSKSKFCPRRETTPAEPNAPPPVELVAPEQPGCALVKRAVELGYAEDLGDCAPKKLAVAEPIVVEPPSEVCTMRQHDEPYLHYAWRRLSGAGGELGAGNLAGAVSHRIDTIETKLDYLDTLVAYPVLAITGGPHASHHLWVNLPDPRKGSWLGDLLEPPKCDERYVDLPMWPAAEPPLSEAGLVEHVLGQLLFATRFGKPPAACRDYTIHWGAPADACARLAENPVSFLDGQGALEPVRDVLDRRRHQLALRRLAEELGERAHVPEPPPPDMVVSLQCFVVDPEGTGAATGGTIELDGVTLAVREVRAPAVEVAGAGPIDVYVRLGAVLVGDAYGGTAADSVERLAGAPAVPEDLAGPGFLLTRLERIHDADPFLGVRWPLERADLLPVYPFHRHLYGFVDAFRRRYRAQRGRL